MSSRPVLQSLTSLLLSLAACQAGPQPLSDADKAANRAVSEAWVKAVRAADWRAVAALYAENATLMPPNEPAVAGRAAIEKYFSAFPKIVDVTVTPVDVDGQGDVAYVRGTYTLALQPEGVKEPLREVGKFVEVRRKQAGGAWLDVIDMFSGDAPAAPAK